MALKGILKLDGDEQKIEVSNLGLRLSTSPDDNARGDLEPFMGTQTHVTISVADGKLTITTTIKPQNGPATTTTSTSEIPKIPQ